MFAFFMVVHGLLKVKGCRPDLHMCLVVLASMKGLFAFLQYRGRLFEAARKIAEAGKSAMILLAYLSHRTVASCMKSTLLQSMSMCLPWCRMCCQTFLLLLIFPLVPTPGPLHMSVFPWSPWEEQSERGT